MGDRANERDYSLTRRLPADMDDRVGCMLACIHHLFDLKAERDPDRLDRYQREAKRWQGMLENAYLRERGRA